jgi:EC042_2821-lke REase
LFTVFKAKLESTKKITKADFVVGVQAQGAVAGVNPLLVHRPIDPNSTHPYREADIITHKDGTAGLGIVIGEQPLTQHPFRALPPI